MTYRERRERRMQRRLDWAASRDRKSAAGFARARAIADHIPLGQPILVGHHSERRHRRDLERIDSGMSAGVESAKMASHHRGCADTIARQLDASIYSDDADAIPALEARIAEREAEAEKRAAVNRAWRKGPSKRADALRALGWTDKGIAGLEKNMAEMPSFVRVPCDLTNLRARIRRDRERLATLRAAESL